MRQPSCDLLIRPRSSQLLKLSHYGKRPKPIPEWLPFWVTGGDSSMQISCTPDGKVAFGCCRNQARLARITYFSYSHNVAIDVRMKDTAVLEASRYEGYLPPRDRKMCNEGSNWLVPMPAWRGRCSRSRAWTPDATGPWVSSKTIRGMSTGSSGLPSPKDRMETPSTGRRWI